MQYVSCTTESTLSEYVTFAFDIILITTLLIISIVAGRESDYVTFGNFKESPKKWLSEWKRVTLSKKKCYFLVLTHIVNNVTGIGVICECGLLEYSNNIDGVYDECGVVNVCASYLFIVSSFALLTYRIYCPLYPRISTNKKYFSCVTTIIGCRRSLMINYKLNDSEPNNPQRMIQTLEAMFESTHKFCK